MTQGDKLISEVQNGEQLIAYSPTRRMMGFVTVQVVPIEPKIKIGLLITMFRWINVLAETMAYTNGGPVPVSTLPSYFTSFCPMNPLKMATREIADVVEYGVVPAVQVSWPEDSYYLWSEGLLVGSK